MRNWEWTEWLILVLIVAMLVMAGGSGYASYIERRERFDQCMKAKNDLFLCDAYSRKADVLCVQRSPQ